jgi:hypothetical protein
MLLEWNTLKYFLSWDANRLKDNYPCRMIADAKVNFQILDHTSYLHVSFLGTWTALHNSWDFPGTWRGMCKQRQRIYSFKQKNNIIKLHTKPAILQHLTTKSTIQWILACIIYDGQYTEWTQRFIPKLKFNKHKTTALMILWFILTFPFWSSECF